MLTRRIIPCLDVLGGRVVKGLKFVHLRDAGDPVELAAFYDREGADELVFLDIGASVERRKSFNGSGCGRMGTTRGRPGRRRDPPDEYRSGRHPGRLRAAPDPRGLRRRAGAGDRLRRGRDVRAHPAGADRRRRGCGAAGGDAASRATADRRGERVSAGTRDPCATLTQSLRGAKRRGDLACYGDCFALRARNDGNGDQPMIELKYDAEGLVPVVAQDAATGQVLMVAYMNREALGKTLQTGEAWYWSRSRRALWRKGEESGHAQTVRRVSVDCDADALLLTVDQHGAACHTGHRSCFFRTLEGSDAAADDERVVTDILDELFELLKRRRA